MPVAAFDGATPTEQSAASDDNGQAILTLLEGNYRFRALYEGATFWSSTVNHCAIVSTSSTQGPGCSGATIEVSLTTQVTVRDVDGQPVAGVEVYAFDGDTYTNFSQVTNENGTAFFVLPFGNYRFRADVGGTAFWSGAENHYSLPTTWPYTDITVGKPVVVSLSRQSGASAANMTVDVYSGTGYIGRTGVTGAAGKVNFTLPEGEYRFRVEHAGTEYWSAVCQVPGCEASGITIQDGSSLQSEVTIDYEYDSLYRLTAADYSTGDYYHYVYDAVGNRLSQESQVNDFPISLAYEYDAANRLMSVGDVAYTYDANGNLLEDGVNTYTYDAANRLSALNGASTTIGYTYNGLNDRLQETVNGSTTTFTMDLNTGLPQALSDGARTYTYGLGRIAQYNNPTAEYFLGDALGSVRQLTDSYGIVTLAKSYDPYGAVSMTAGTSQSSYGYTSEFQDSYIKLIYLRSRYLSPETGRFQTRDTWQGDYNRPGSLNRWNYTDGNPINLTDPSGLAPNAEAGLQTCISSPKLNGVEMNMKTYVCRMIAELESEGYLVNVADDAHIRDGRRTPQDAHKYSTAYHILHDFVSIDDLRKTPKDLDNNTWYKEEWDIFYCLSQDVHLDPQKRTGWIGYLDYLVKKNASDLAKDIHMGGNFGGYIYTPWGRVRDVYYALEGYIYGDLHRLPNSSYPEVSRHVSGWAVDVSEDILREDIWLQQGFTVIDEIAHKHGLKRPYNNQSYVWYTTENLIAEWWHFEREFGFR